MEKTKYVTNKDLLREIHNAKTTFCTFLEPQFAAFDVIVNSLDLIDDELIEKVLHKKNHPKGKEKLVLNHTPEDLVFRLMTFEHIPLDPERKRKARNTDQNYTRTNFPPFKHYVIREGKFVEVGRSHWKGSFEDGEFTLVKGRVTNDLARMHMLLVERYSRRGNWRSYSYVDEMRSQALVQLSQVGLQFDENKSDNPFAFYTQVMKNCVAGNTMVLTREYGSVPIEQVSEQDVTLLDGNGNWVKCHIYDHGIQETQTNTFQGGFETVTIRSTLNHGWINGGERALETAHFAGRNSRIDDLRPSKVIIDEAAYRKGVVHGLFYGDGSARLDCKDFYFMRVCANHDCIEPWLSDYPKYNCPSHNGDPTYSISQAWTNLKAFPTNPGENLDYLLGFLRGWFAADGCVSKVPYATLCGDIAEYEWIKRWGPLVGWHVRSSTLLAEATNFGLRKKASRNIHLKKASVDAEDFLLEQHRTRWTYTRRPHVWNVYGSKQTNERQMERVYCPVVETTQSFALSSGIHSANCFTRILLNEKKSQSLRDDMLIMAGVAPSFTRQVANEIENKFGASDSITLKKPPVKRRGPAPKPTPF